MARNRPSNYHCRWFFSSSKCTTSGVNHTDRWLVSEYSTVKRCFLLRKFNLKLAQVIKEVIFIQLPGIRMLPPISVPRPNTDAHDAISAPSPPLDPPTVRRIS